MRERKRACERGERLCVCVFVFVFVLVREVREMWQSGMPDNSAGGVPQLKLPPAHPALRIEGMPHGAWPALGHGSNSDNPGSVLICHGSVKKATKDSSSSSETESEKSALEHFPCNRPQRERPMDGEPPAVPAASNSGPHRPWVL